MRIHHLLKLIPPVLVMLITAFSYINVEILNRFSQVDNVCLSQIDADAYNPAQFKSSDMDTSPYLMADYQQVTFPARDGVMINGFFIPAALPDISEARTVMIVHGFDSCKRNLVSLLPAGMLHRHDFNVLVIDLRNHGESEITTGRMDAGVLEALDVLGAWDWLQQTHSLSPPQIGLAGFSMGGATVIHAMADEPQIAAGWSDSAFDSMQRVVAFHTEAAGLPLLFAETVFPVGAIFFGVDVLDDRAIDAVQMLEDHPLYLVHSTNDAIVPFASAVALYEAARQTNDNIDFWKIDASPHVLHMVHAPQMYEQRLVDFFETHLQSADS